MRKVFFKKIEFLDLKDSNFNDIINKSGLFVFPSAPGLASINEKIKYFKALKKADYIFFDSGFFVLLLRLFKNISVNKFSGFKFLKFFFIYLKNNKNLSIYCIDPNIRFSKSNNKFIKKLGIKKVDSYLAPKYDPKNLHDHVLLKKIKLIKPNYILTNIGGGTQEILGMYLKKNIKFKTTILCTGGAISFFTGDQAPINDFIDKFYLGWLIRLIFNPITFFKRFIYAFKLIKIVILSKVKTKLI